MLRRSAIVYVLALAAFGCVLARVSPPRAYAQERLPLAGSEPAVFATGFTVRALAVGFDAAQPHILVTTAEQPNRIFAVGPKSTLDAVAGRGDTGSSGDGGVATEAQLDIEGGSPVMRSGIVVAPDGSVFIADTLNATIRRISGPQSSEPGIIRSVAGRWAPPQNVALVDPLGLAIDRAGNLFIADHGSDSVLQLHAETGQLEILAHVVRPASLAVTLDGATIFVAAPDAGRVFAIDTKTRAIRVALDSTTIEAPQQVAATTAGIPAGLAVDGGSNLFVSFANLNRIYRIGAHTGVVSLVAVANPLQMPGDMAFDLDGNLYVADQGHKQILKFAGMGQSANGVTLTPTSFNFGDEPNGGSTSTQSFTLTNNSGAMLTGISVGFQGGDSGDFQQNSTSCLATLANNSSCGINVAFTPTGTGARSSTLMVMNSSVTQQAAVSGTGDDYELSLAPGQIQSLTVVAGNSVTFNLQASNDAVFMGTVTFECPGNLPAATFCTITPSSANLTAPSTTIPFMITLQTTSRTKVPGTEVSPFQNVPRKPQGPIPFPAVFSFAAVLSLLLITLRSRSRRSSAILALSTLAIFAALLGGCHHKGLTINGTPAGTTDLIVQGTAQNATRGVHIQLVVQ